MSIPKLNKLGEKLKYLLAVNEYTQQQLADKLGTTQQCISRWINGNREPSIDDILLICYFLNEDPNELLGFNDISQDEFKKFDNLFKLKKR